MEIDILHNAIISIVISVVVFSVIKLVIARKLTNLKGAQKLLGLILLIIGVIEIVFLGTLFDLFTLAASVIASFGVAFALVSFALQNHLKNIVSGIGLYLNKKINIGDAIEIDGKKGIITEFHLLKTIAETTDGNIMNIPNLKFSETVILISSSQNQ